MDLTAEAAVGLKAEAAVGLTVEVAVGRTAAAVAVHTALDSAVKVAAVGDMEGKEAVAMAVREEIAATADKEAPEDMVQGNQASQVANRCVLVLVIQCVIFDVCICASFCGIIAPKPMKRFRFFFV